LKYHYNNRRTNYGKNQIWHGIFILSGGVAIMKNIKKVFCRLLILAFIFLILASCTGTIETVNELTDTTTTEEITEVIEITTTVEEPTYPEFEIELTKDDEHEYRFYEKMLNYSFVPHDEILGEWQVFAFCLRADFDNNKVSTFEDDFIEYNLEDFINYYLENDMENDYGFQYVKFYDGGKAKIKNGFFNFSTEWTKGHILNIFPDCVSRYKIKNIGGVDYMFAGGMGYDNKNGKIVKSPSYYVLRKTSEFIPDIPDDLTRYDTIGRKYDWYLDQSITGEYSNVNCGPTCAVMAAKWYDENFKMTVEEAREQIPNDVDEAYASVKDGWNINTMRTFLDSENIPHEIYRGISYDDIVRQLNMGHIMIVSVDMKYIYKTEESVFHYIIIKGIRTVEEEEFFEIYNPFSHHVRTFSTGELIGKNCLYLCDDVIEASINYGGFYIVIKQKDYVSYIEPIVNEQVDVEDLFNIEKTEVIFMGKQITPGDIEKLRYMVNLQSLYIGWNSQFSDISELVKVLAGLTNLTQLDLTSNQISDINPLAILINLTNLDLQSNQISDISALAGLTNLTRLILINNQISDISALAGLMKLTILNLDENQINDISVLTGLTNLKMLFLRNNPLLTSEQIEEFRKALPNIEIYFDY